MMMSSGWAPEKRSMKRRIWKIELSTITGIFCLTDTSLLRSEVTSSDGMPMPNRFTANAHPNVLFQSSFSSVA